MKSSILFLALTLSSCAALAQSQDAYENKGGDSTTGKGLYDPARFSISHSMNFGMTSNAAEGPGMQSSSFYSTGLQYKFVAPVTVNLDFALPIYSSFSKYQNFSTDNMQSLEYFKNMPFDMSLSWEPTKNMHFVFSVVKAPGDGTYNSTFSPMRLSPFSTRW